MKVTAPRSDGDWEQFVGVVARSFMVPLDDRMEQFSRIRPHAVAMFAMEGESVIGGAVAYRTGQFFGGRPVPAAPIRSVCVLPGHRGRGVGSAVMRGIDSAVREGGAAVAPLWPSTIRFYRDCGWELVERGHQQVVAARALAGMTGRGQAVLGEESAIRKLQAECAPAWNGPLERPGWWWDQRHTSYPFAEVRAEHRALYGWTDQGDLTGFLEYFFRRSPQRGIEVVVSDLWAKTFDAFKGLCGLLGSHAAQANDIIFPFWVLPNRNDFVWALSEAERDLRTEGRVAWMLRLVHPARALEARGWPPAATARLEFEIGDPLVKRQDRLVLEVAGGRASAQPGGSGRVRVSVGGLASWYAGALRATDAARLGLLQAEPADLQAMDALAGDRPVWLAEYF